MAFFAVIKNGVAWLLRRPQMLAVGAQAPDFTAMAHDGSTVRLGDLRGKKVVLWFYPKAGTGG